MEIGDFERDTRPVGGDARYVVTLSRAWDVWGPNGGYVAAIALRAMAAEARLPRPGAFHCQFLKAGRFELAQVLVERLRAGKRSEALRARIVQDGEDLVAASLWMTADAMDGLEHDHAQPFTVPGPRELKSFAELYDNYASWYPYWRSVEARPVGEEVSPSAPQWCTWLRLASPVAELEPVLAAARTVFWMDLGPWNAAARPHPHPRRYLGPNLDLHVQFHDLSRQDEWTLIESEAPLARDGLIGTTVRAISETGSLIASGGSMLFCRRNPLYEEQLRQMRGE
ncbi:MAG: thioesterase family protein [Hyphomonadaceae bacterium]|nr:thioesterase family protein [Hyphomonadaceae bacterium]